MLSTIEKRYFNIKELSKYTGLPTSTLYEWAAQRVIPSIKIGGRILFDINDIYGTLEAKKRREFNPNKKASEIIRGV